MKRIEQLDGVRALAIGAVFLHHAFHARLLWAGVDLFFILSGFLITGILLGAKTKPLGSYFEHFYERRARRILPPYLLLLLVVSVFFGTLWMHYWYLFVFLMNALASFPVFNVQALAVLWSLSVEEQFYMVWPFAVYFLSETAVAWTAGALVVLARCFAGCVLRCLLPTGLSICGHRSAWIYWPPARCLRCCGVAAAR